MATIIYENYDDDGEFFDYEYTDTDWFPQSPVEERRRPPERKFLRKDGSKDDDKKDLDGNGKDDDWQRKSSNGKKKMWREPRMRSQGLRIIVDTKNR